MRRRFVAEALRVAPQLYVIAQAWRPGLPEEAWEDRSLRDGSRHRVFKRYFTPERLAAELAGKVALATSSFVAVLVDRPRSGAEPKRREGLS